MSRFHSLLPASSFVFALIIIVSPSWGMIQIDAFEVPTPAVINTTAPDASGYVIDGPRSGPGILGTRMVMKSGNAFEPGDSITVGDGALTVVSQALPGNDSIFTTQVEYDFTGLPGGSISLSGQTGLALTFALISSDHVGSEKFMDSFIDIDTVSGTMQAIGIHFDDLTPGLRTDVVDFSLFTTGSGDLSQVTGLRFWFNDPLTASRLDFTLTNVAGVPEPMTWVLLALLAAFSSVNLRTIQFG